MSSELNKRVRITDKINGIIRYEGPIKGKEGNWAGVELDVAVGPNDGTYDGRRYFSCEPGYGLFIRATRLKNDELGNQYIDSTQKAASTSRIKERNSASEVKFLGNIIVDGSENAAVSYKVPDNMDLGYSFNPNYSLFEENGCESAHQPFKTTLTSYYQEHDRPIVDHVSSSQKKEIITLKNQVEEYRGMFYSLANKTKAFLSKLNDKIENMRLRLIRIKKYPVELSERDKVVFLVSAIYWETKKGNYSAVEPFYTEFKNIIFKYHIKIDD